VRTDKPAPTAVSLFSGAGGMDVGVINAGFEVVLANDINPDACATYRLNHGDMIVEGTILSLSNTFSHLKNIDLVFGGPPCQGFSVAGKMDPTDPRSGLMHSFFDAIDAINPRAFICENVKALAVLSKWEDTRLALMKRASKNYLACLVVVNASHFGVPQNRDRMFIIGIRKDQFAKSRAEFVDFVTDQLALSKQSPETIGDIVQRLGPAGSQGNTRVCNAKITFCKSPVLRKSPFAGMLFNGAGRPIDANGISSTLPASMGGNKTPIVDEDQIFGKASSYVKAYHTHLMRGKTPRKGNAPTRLRRLTVDECLAIQTFPETYNLAGSRSSMYRQIGNAVPCKLAHVVADVVKSALDIADINHDYDAPTLRVVGNS
jgi:DNA (cytosine-5)-methyltransferase 1